MKIRAAVLREMGLPSPYATSKPLSVETVYLDDPGEGEVLVEIAAAGLCHSDLSVMSGDRPRPMPMVLGHEAAGVVRALGPGVRDLEVGDHVVLVFVPSCGGCVPCASGRPALCEPGAAANGKGALLSGARRLRFTEGGDFVNHHIGVSCFADHAVVSRRSLVKIDREVPLEQAALFGCAVLTGVGAVLNTAAVPAGSSVAVIGLGGVGLNALLAASLAGAARVIAVDVQPTKLVLARELGATDTFDAMEPGCVAAVRAATSGGDDFAFEMAGSAAAMKLAYEITRRGGTTVTAGLPPPSQTLAVPLANLVAEERTVKGSYIGSSVPIRDVPRFLALFRRGLLPVDRLMSGRVPLADINVALDRLAAGEVVRQIVSFS